MGTLRRLAVGAVVALGVTTGLPAASSAAPPPPPSPTQDLAVSGAFTARGTLGSECGVFHILVDGEGDWADLGETTFTLDFCLGPDMGSEPWPIFDGTFAITTADGSVSGDLDGTVAAGPATGPDPAFPFPLHFVLTVTGGTGRFAGASGSIAMEGAFGPAAISAAGTVEGTISRPAPTPERVADCLRGGWRDVVDDHGRPFRGPAHCILWVIHHNRHR